MKSKYLFICLLAASFVFPLIGTFAQQPPSASVEVVTTFDYPGDVTQTIPEGINDRGDITGLYVDSSGVTRGFIRFHSGTFSPPIVEPNDAGNLTEGRGINYARTVGGFYAHSDGTFHGYFLARGTFTEFDIPGSTNTYVEGVNSRGDFVGASDESGALMAFKNILGTTATIDISGASSSYAFGINDRRQATGQYTDGSTGTIHGYLADTDGTVTTFDPPRATQTLPFGINNRSMIVGRFTDNSTGRETGFVFKSSAGGYVTFEYPGAVFTSINGINIDGALCGRYDDGSGILHGYLARLVTGQ